ncbi:MAG TPA: transketolase [Terriglobales bacterium]|nr:transketolase [Terriglobales bacterium]
MASKSADLALHNLATQLRIDSIQATTAAGSGHPTSSMSAAEIMALLFFEVMRLDPQRPQAPENDKFILSKGHAAPVLYAVWAELGLFSREHLLTLRRFGSNLEGHPTPELPFVAVPTGSLGQGLAVGLGMALQARLAGAAYRSFVLMGDGETAEGSVWEAAGLASFYHVDNLCAIVDVNRLGQSQPTMLQHDMEGHQQRWAAFGWNALVVDGHDIPQLRAAFANAEACVGKPTVLLARTLKGKGVSFVEDKNGWHGKALKAGEEADSAVAELQQQMRPDADAPKPWPRPPAAPGKPLAAPGASPAPNFKAGQQVATREAFGQALAALGQADARLVAVDGDVENSTFTQDFQKLQPERFFEGYIAEQNMTGMAMGLATTGRIPFVSTFACFLTRAADFIRLAGLARANVKFVGTHAGISIGEDGGSQMGLEDLSLFRALPESVVLYPSDAVSTWRAVELVAAKAGLCYIRTGRPKAALIYGNDEPFAIGKAKVLRQSAGDKATVIAAGVTIFEALAAQERLQKEGIAIRVIDLFSVRPVDQATLLEAAKASGNLLITVEDHYAAGGLGDAVCEAVAPAGVRVRRLAVAGIPRSGQPAELLHHYRIDADAIVAEVKASLKA